MGSIPRLTAVGDAIGQEPHSPVSYRTPSSKLALQDTVELDTVPSSPQLRHMESTNRSEFQQTLASAVRQLRAAASQTADSSKAGLLTSLANKFQQLEETGVILP